MTTLATILALLTGCHSLQFRSIHWKLSSRTPAVCEVRQSRDQGRKSCETYCPDSNLPRANSLSGSAPFLNYPPLIHHLQSDTAFPTLSAFIAFETKLPHTYICELIAFGAVYFSIPKKTPANVIDDISRHRAARVRHGHDKEILFEYTHGNALVSPTSTMTRVSRVLKVDTPVPKGSYCRVHVNPRRCREATVNMDWKKRLIYSSSSLGKGTNNEDGILFVDKIAGVPVSATVDNIGENMAYQLQLLLPRESPPLHLASRLDVCTSGVVPLAKNEKSAGILSKAIAERTIDKTYLALCRKRVPTGIMRHCFRRKSKSHENAKPTLLREYDPSLLLLKNPTADNNYNTENTETNGISTDPQYSDNKSKKKIKTYPGSRSGNQAGCIWQLAELEVLRCRKVRQKELSADLLSVLKKENDGVEDDLKSLYECEIRLVTGRTHQIRLQFAAIGAAIIGDTRYSPVEGLLDHSFEEGKGREEEDEDEEGQVERQTEKPVERARKGVNQKFIKNMIKKDQEGNRDKNENEIEDKGEFNISKNKNYIGDGAHMMGPEPKRFESSHPRIEIEIEMQMSI